MAITDLQEKQNKKFYVPIRGGNRGGWSLFKWDTVRQMPYKEREMYLGNSATIGVLDKGGKWRKKDWYIKTQKKYKAGQKTEMEQAMRRDQDRINADLGIEVEERDQEAFTEQEMKQLLKKIKNKGEYDEPDNGQKMIGMGFDKTKVQIRAKPTLQKDNPHRLEAVEEQEKVKNQSDQRKDRKEKKVKKEKKHKKEKKQKRQHKEKHRRDNSTQKDKKKNKKAKRRVESPSDND